MEWIVVPVTRCIYWCKIPIIGSVDVSGRPATMQMKIILTECSARPLTSALMNMIGVDVLSVGVSRDA